MTDQFSPEKRDKASYETEIYLLKSNLRQEKELRDYWYTQAQLNKKDVRWLQALDAAGVDNWQGIDYAHELLEAWNDK